MKSVALFALSGLSLSMMTQPAGAQSITADDIAPWGVSTLTDTQLDALRGASLFVSSPSLLMAQFQGSALPGGKTSLFIPIDPIVGLLPVEPITPVDPVKGTPVGLSIGNAQLLQSNGAPSFNANLQLFPPSRSD